jgi:recombination protein RecA
MLKRANRVIAGGEFRHAWVVSSGSVLLDSYLGPGGYPSGSIIQYMSAAEGSFKTSFALKCLGLIQDKDMPVGFVDAEHALDTLWAANMGVVIDDKKWFMSRPYTAEEAFDDAIEMITKHGCKGVVIDSIDACQPSALVDWSDEGKGIDDATIGLHAKSITRGIRKLLPVLEEYQAIVFAINQMKVNLTQMGARGNNPTGGKGLQFYSRFNLEMTRGSNSENLGKDIIPIRMRILRSKLGRSFEDINTYAVQGGTIDENLELIELAKAKRLLTKSGSWWKDNNKVTVGQSIEDAAEWCKNNKALIL